MTANTLTIDAARTALKAREMTAVELTETCIAAMNTGDALNAFVHKTPEGAPVFTPGTALAAEFGELEPRGGEKVVGKQFPGSFTGTDLDEFLKGTGRGKVVLTG